MASSSNQLKDIDNKLREIDRKIMLLKEEKELLQAKKESLQDQCSLERSKNLALKDWSGNNFPWSNNLGKILTSSFRINYLRTLQLEAINATMSKEDTILIMPTGGGKSLCYQLPAYLSTGLTLVISPLVALMEDQVHNLKKLGIEAIALSANSSKEEVKKATDALQNPISTTRLVYVTPERLAKSKRFMNQLQKCAAQGRFARLAIDEVHCCSTWGHDFRTDYNFLGVLKDMFPKVPILGLTATSSAKVTLDVQKMLNIEGCLVLRAPFNRPNLFYSVIRKPSSMSECAELISSWLHGRFRGQTGIVYTTTIKDCESLAKELKQSDLKVGVYHAMLDADVRNKMYEKWVSGAIQLVVATIAFGLGIDKPDVRFVIHHSIPKSMEMQYQESGRAGRDGLPADCIVLYNLADVIKLSTMVFTQRTGLDNLHGVVQYCLDTSRCRRSIIAEYFDEVWDEAACKKMCDHCLWGTKSARKVDAAPHCQTLLKILNRASDDDKKMTAKMLLSEWKPSASDRLSATDQEIVLSQLLCQGYFKEDFHYTAYSTICYIKKGPKSSILDEKSHAIMVELAELPKQLKKTIKEGLDDVKTESQSERPAAKKRKMQPDLVDIT